MTWLRAQWHVPVPIKPAWFTALHSGHQAFNIQTDLSQIDTFGTTPEMPEDALWADLQLNPDFNTVGRLGSGRAGVYRERYLKGMGRTTLAANWMDPRDRYHNSGHQLTSAAVREYLVSVLLDALGITDCIVPCEGVLVGSLDDRLRAFLAETFTDDDVNARCFLPCDSACQAVSIKGAEFARASNILWLLSRVGLDNGAIQLPHVFTALADHLPERPDAATTAPALVARLGAAFDRGLQHFKAYLEHGIYWGSYHNNITLDGRFLDLEVATFLGGPTLALLATKAKDGRRKSLAVSDLRQCAGLEIVHYIHHTRAFIRLLGRTIGVILDEHQTLTAGAREYAVQFVEALAALFSPQHLLESDDELAQLIVAWTTESCDLDAGTQAIVKRLVAQRLRPSNAWLTESFAMTETALVAVEPTFIPQIYGLAGAPWSSEHRHRANEFSECLRLPFEAADPDRVLSAVQDAERRIRRGFSSISARAAGVAPTGVIRRI
jgi:hypothetical protein